MKILVLNSGSSSQKISLYDVGDTIPTQPPPSLWAGEIGWEGHAASVAVTDSQGFVRKSRLKVPSRPQAVAQLLKTLSTGHAPVVGSASEIQVVGHRVVHGGPKYREPILVTPRVKSAIAGVSAFAPLHNRAELEGMKVVDKLFKRVPQIAVFDTGFHREMPLPATVYPGPYKWFTDGIRRYGFHGINHQYCAGRASQLLGQDLQSLKLVTCHLGNGCSLAAIRNGHSIDTTMGFTPLEGLMMGTRSGSVDPGILTYLMRQHRLSGKQIDEMLNQGSGLLGISGLSSDMRSILAARKKGHKRASLAFDIYVHRLRIGIGAMVAALGGIDALVFTAGVGENSWEVRAETCQALEFLGLKLDSGKNARCSPDEDISDSKSAVRVLVIRAQEDWAIAGECWKLIQVKAAKTGLRIGGNSI
jgi:acetate kinase